MLLNACLTQDTRRQDVTGSLRRAASVCLTAFPGGVTNGAAVGILSRVDDRRGVGDAAWGAGRPRS
jgi:hypothetical protein